VSRIRTLVRVAELQEAVARGSAARALLAVRASEQVYVAQLAHLRAARVEGGSRNALTSSLQTLQVRAAAVSEAAGARDEADSARQDAVDEWTDARRRHRLMTELASRKRDEEITRRDRADQVVSDELAGSRKLRR
jgi:flagellar biosynthesis chaperone FliJ